MSEKKQQLIESEKKRYMQLIEFTFATEDIAPEDVIVEDGEDEDSDNLESDEKNEMGDNEIPNDEVPNDEVPNDEVPNDEGFNDEDFNDEDFNDEDLGVEDFNGEGDMGDFNEESTEEIDITQLVNSTEEAKAAAEESTQKTIELAGGLDTLMNSFQELSGQIKKMDAINAKIDLLGQEIEKRNPTPVEKLEMRSMDSYPYNVKLTDYWKGVNDNYETTEEEEFTLTQDDVNDEYNETEARESFSLNKIKENVNIYDEMLSDIKKKTTITESGNQTFAVIQWTGANDKESYNDNRTTSKIVRKIKDITGSLRDKDATYQLIARDISLEDAKEINDMNPVYAKINKIIPMSDFNEYYIYDRNGNPLSFL